MSRVDVKCQFLHLHSTLHCAFLLLNEEMNTMSYTVSKKEYIFLQYFNTLFNQPQVLLMPLNGYDNLSILKTKNAIVQFHCIIVNRFRPVGLKQ